MQDMTNLCLEMYLSLMYLLFAFTYLSTDWKVSSLHPFSIIRSVSISTSVNSYNQTFFIYRDAIRVNSLAE